MAVNLGPGPKFQAFADDGSFLVGGKLSTYAHGTATPLPTYQDATGGAANTNPTILDARGEANVWFTEGLAYDIVLHDADDVLIWQVDDLLVSSGPRDGSILPSPGLFTLLSGTFTASTRNGLPDIPLAGFFSAPQLILMVKLEVTTQFGASNGLTSLSLGDSVTQDRFGGGLSLTTGAKSPRGVPYIYTADTTLSLYANGGVFDSAGVATIEAIVLTMPQSGTSGGSSGPTSYAVNFTAVTSVTILGTDHGLGTADLLIAVYDNSSPRQLITPGSITIDPGTFDIVITFAFAESGRIVVAI